MSNMSNVNNVKRQNQQVKEIDLLKVGKQLWAKKWFLLLGALIGTVLVLGYTLFLVKPTYESKAVFYVNNKNSSSTSNQQTYSTTELSAAQSLVDTYIVILQQYSTLQDVIDKHNLPYSYEELKNMISASAENNTEIFSVTATATDPYAAMLIVNGIADVLPEKIAAVVDGASVRVVEEGRANTEQVAPSYKKNGLLGCFGGLLIAAVIVLIKFFMDKKIHGADFVDELPEPAPLLAVIPDLSKKGSSKKKGYGYGYGYGYGDTAAAKQKEKKAAAATGEARFLCSNLAFDATEAYKLLKTNVLFALTEKTGCVVIGVTSSIRGEAKSTTAINLAYTFAETGKKVLSIDADMRLPVLAKRLNLKTKPGLSDIIGGFSSIKDSLQAIRTHSNWYAITSGSIPPNPSELLEAKRMSDVLTIMRKNFDYIIVDLPPVNAVTDALSISPYLDGMIAVAREEYSNVPALSDAVQKLKFGDVNLLGFVLTGSASAQKTAYYRQGNNKN